jgi:DNA-binding XRE family transcriptional regulator
MTAGQPLKFKSVKDLQKDVDRYFAKCDLTDKPYTITGLALFLGTSRQTLINYESGGVYAKFFDTIKTAKTRVENYAEEKLFGNNATGPIFALKNFGWKDKKEVDQNTNMTVNISKEDAGVL